MATSLRFDTSFTIPWAQVIETPWLVPAPPDGAALLAPLLARPRTEPEVAPARKKKRRAPKQRAAPQRKPGPKGKAKRAPKVKATPACGICGMTNCMWWVT